MPETILFGTNKILNARQWLGSPMTHPSLTQTQSFICSRNGTLSNFYMYQSGQNYSSTEQGNSFAEYCLFINNGASGFLAFNVYGSSIKDNTMELKIQNSNDVFCVNAGDMLSFVITPADNAEFNGNGNFLFSMQYD